MNPAKELERSLVSSAAGITIITGPAVKETAFSFPPERCINLKNVYPLAITDVKVGEARKPLFGRIEFCGERLSRHNSLFVCERCKDMLFGLHAQFDFNKLKRPKKPKRPKNLEHNNRSYISRKEKAAESLRDFYLECFIESFEKMRAHNG